MADEQPITLAVCTDCMLWAVNNDDSGASEDWTARVDKPVDDIPGTTVRQHISQLVLIDADEEPAFSWSPCHACGSWLGGDRFDMVEAR